jgi:hypothetical protein
MTESAVSPNRARVRISPLPLEFRLQAGWPRSFRGEAKTVHRPKGQYPTRVNAELQHRPYVEIIPPQFNSHASAVSPHRASVGDLLTIIFAWFFCLRWSPGFSRSSLRSHPYGAPAPPKGGTPTQNGKIFEIDVYTLRHCGFIPTLARFGLTPIGSTGVLPVRVSHGQDGHATRQTAEGTMQIAPRTTPRMAAHRER